jgi:hypothetical protein
MAYTKDFCNFLAIMRPYLSYSSPSTYSRKQNKDSYFVRFSLFFSSHFMQMSCVTDSKSVAVVSKLLMTTPHIFT